MHPTPWTLALLISALGCEAPKFETAEGAGTPGFEHDADGDDDGGTVGDDDDGDDGDDDGHDDGDDDGTTEDTAADADAEGTDTGDPADLNGGTPIDTDGDGVLAEDDCDDSDAVLGAVALDADCDGWTTESDCNDTDSSISPDATEVDDGEDNDCDGFIDEGVAGDYSEEGPWNAGVITDNFTSRDGVDLWVDIWAPSLGSGTGAATYYGGPTWILSGDGYRDATPDCSETRPVMVHSHGSTSIRWEMFYLMEFMASHGWIIVAPDHAGNTFYENWGILSPFLSRRPTDVQDAYNWLLDQNADPTSPLSGCVDEDAGYVASGYSFGGYTALVTGGAAATDWDGEDLVGLADPRVTAIVTQAAWNAGAALTVGTADITVPTLTIGGERDSTVGTAYESMHAYIESTPRALASFFDAGHYSPAAIYCAAWGDGCGPYYMSTDVYEDIVKTSVLAFVEHLQGREGAWEQRVEDPDAVRWETVRE